MGDSAESTPDDPDKEFLSGSTGDLSLRRVKPPNKKKHEEDLDSLNTSIKEKEAELKRLVQNGDSSVKDGLRTTRSEKLQHINRLKDIDVELKTCIQESSKKKASLDRLQVTLHYKNEDRIDESIKRLEYSLKMQNFKLKEEKRIVAEIDSLKRSKKVLRDFLAIKKEIDEMKDKQKTLREERDSKQKLVNQLRRSEEQFKRDSSTNRGRRDTLKKELDKMYEMKRQHIAEFRQLEKEFVDNKVEIKKLKRKESFKFKEKEVKEKPSCSQMEAFQNSIKEYTLPCTPYEDEIKLCNTLVTYLNKFSFNVENDAMPEDSIPVSKSLDLSASSSSTELEDGMYVLKKKSFDDDLEYSGLGKKSGKRRPSKKGRKQSVTKPITHTPQIFSQFASLNLSAPSNISEIPASLEQLQARKDYYMAGRPPTVHATTPTIEEHHASDAEISSSDAGISQTESGMCEMSRQASNTESTENADATPCYILDELVKLSSEETMSEKSEDTLGRSNSNSDSTEHAHSEGDGSDVTPPHSDDHGRSSSFGSDSISEETSVSVSQTRDTACVSDSLLNTKNTGTENNICKPNVSYMMHNLDINKPEMTSSSNSKVVIDPDDDCQEDYEFDLPEQSLS